MPIFKMAWRNIWRNKRRTGLCIAVLAFSTAVLIILMANVNGLQEQIIESSVTTFNGYIQINRKGYHGNESLAGFIEGADDIARRLEKLPNIEAVTTRIQSSALISHGENSVGCLMVGIDPEREPKVTIFSRGVRYGRFLEARDKSAVLISEEMAKRLSVTVNSEITVLVQSHRGSLEAMILKAVGIFDLGNAELNQNVVFVPHETAAQLTSLDDKASQIIVNVETDRKLDSTVAQIREELEDFRAFYGDIPIDHSSRRPLVDEFGDAYVQSKRGIEFETGFEVLPWRQILIPVVQFIEVENFVIQIILVVVFAAVFLIVLNVLIMSIMERRKEFGIMKAIGTKSRQLLVLLVSESMMITALGVGVGAAIGGATAMYLYLYPLDLAVSIDIFNSGMLRPKVMAILSVQSILQPVLFAMATGFLASLLTGWNIVKLTPVEAIHSH